MSKIEITSQLNYRSLMNKSKDDLAHLVLDFSDSKDAAYRERNLLVAALSKLFPAYIGRHEPYDPNWDRDWTNVIYIILPAGQVSWHIHDSELNLFSHLKLREYGPHWDGHTTDEKYRRLASLEKTA